MAVVADSVSQDVRLRTACSQQIRQIIHFDYLPSLWLFLLNCAVDQIIVQIMTVQIGNLVVRFAQIGLA